MGSMKDQPEAPRPPNPQETTDAQAEANRRAIQESARVNRYDQNTPYGSVSWNRPTNDPSTWTQNVNLTPEMQQRLDNENQISQGIQGAAMQNIQGLPQGQFSTEGAPELSTDFSGDAQRMEQATFDRAMGLMEPQFEQRERSMENRLAQQGLPMGGEAYNDERTRFDRSRNEAELAAAMESVGAGRQEHSRMFDVNQRARQQEISDRQLERNQPYNELAMLMGQDPGMQTMNPPQGAQYQIAPPDSMGAEQLAYQGELNNYNTQMGNQQAKKGGTTGLLGTLGGAAINQWG